ncbi:type IV-A pilus assembly ATPase PilB [Oceanisphaera arctica]|uniref:Type IV-A pilus assembly ATPase PilB n=1 Tax=Oceanisphaera arctica TaxID=641510 RepID=A0A2P5TND2_9GAMM|nr:type IV-A pilus assembly ATPase PilB [Oceanisphaera arctica]PPL17093.1 type IV-A pilus assembly ATPase PilB [Oceanisphaera arctica]GHA04218.1 type IV-A pilus assembly ATPase PilB [Oceanisphaera arctica]
MTVPINTIKSGLARSLAASSLLTADQLEQAFGLVRQEGKPLSTVLVDHQFLSSTQLASFCEMEYGLPLTDLDEVEPDQVPPQYLCMDLIERHHVVPIILQGSVLYLAMADPTDVAALEDFGFRFNLITDAKLVEEDKLQRLLARLQQAGDALDLDHIEDNDIADLELGEDPAERNNDDLGKSDDDAPIVRYINKIMLDAVRREASDLHFEPYERFYRIRFRIDGMLHEIATPPINLGTRFAARLKVMARLDIAERRLPQDGRIKLKLTRTKSVDMRVNSLPTQWGEKIVIRILDSSAAKLDIDTLGYDEHQKQLYLSALKRPQGMILVTGPTGSGKTVSLYTGLSILNTVSANISTAEDPVEITLPGINQVQINPKSGLSFAHALRAFLRQDPDIIMVGEIRDLETAEIAVKAAQTGHLVLSTLHTNSAAETLTRLSNMGLPAYNIASSVTLIMAQRLARKLCPECKEEEHIPEEQLLELGFTVSQLSTPPTLFKAVGCNLCTEGYKGRIGIYEVLPMNDTLANLIMDGANSLTLARAAEESGMISLRQAALEKARLGIISLAEVSRITL